MRTVPLRRLFARSRVLGFVDEPMLSVYRDHGVVLKDETSNPNRTAEDRSIYQLVDEGWLVVNRMKAWQGSLGISSRRGIVSGHYICFRPTHSENSRYLHYLLRSPGMTKHFESISRGVRPGQSEIDNDDLAATPLPLPDLDKQERVADFLDDRVARIDRIIGARRRQSAKASALAGARIQTLQDALTHRWGEVRLGQVLEGLEQGWSPQADAVPAEPTEWGVMRSGCVNGGQFRPDDNKRLPASLAPRTEYELRAGDLLMSRASGSLDLIGSVAVVPTDVRSHLLLCDKIYRLRPASGWKAGFLALMLSTPRSRELIRWGVSGAEGMANNLPSGIVRDLRVPRAPTEDQEQAVLQGSEILKAERTLIAASTRSIELLAEYKASLITAAVSGELDVATTGSAIPA